MTSVLRTVGRVRRGGMGGLLVFLFCVAGGVGDAVAEVRHLEVVGAVSLDSKTRQSGLPKDKAISEALWEGVSRVAAGLLEENALPEGEDGGAAGARPDGGNGGAPGGAAGSGEDADNEPLREALGADMVPYTRSFRILEDQGERPALFNDEDGVATEYVVVVEVQVDVDRVRERLRSAGLLRERGEAGETTRIQLELQGLSAYAGYEEFVELLKAEAVGVASVEPSEFERGRILLAVRAEWGAQDLSERLRRAAPPHMGLTVVSVAGSGAIYGVLGARGTRQESLVLSVDWRPPPNSEFGGDEGASKPAARR